MHDAPGPTPAPAMPPPPQAPCRWHGGSAAVVGCAACGAPLCGECAVQIVEPGAPAWAAACPTCAPNYQTPSSVPLDDPSRGAGAWPATLTTSLFQPRRFFTSFRGTPLGSAIAYAYLAGLPAALINALFSWAAARAQAAMREANPGAPLSPFGSMGNDEQIRALEPVMQGMFTAAPLVLWLLTPLSMGAVAGAVHLAARMFGGRAPFAATFRACLFLTPLWCLTAPSPLCCAPLWFGWFGAVMFHALRRPHGLSDGQALGALAVTAVMLTFLGCAFGLALGCGGMVWAGPEAWPQ